MTSGFDASLPYLVWMPWMILERQKGRRVEGAADVSGTLEPWELEQAGPNKINLYLKSDRRTYYRSNEVIRELSA